VEALLRRSAPGADSTQLQVADLRLDLRTLRVTRGNKVITLQPREYRLLEYLMRNENQVVTRTMLLESVWDYHFDPQTNVIDVQISRLRAKVDKDFPVQLIHTLRGVGYRMGVTPPDEAELDGCLAAHLDRRQAGAGLRPAGHGLDHGGIGGVLQRHHRRDRPEYRRQDHGAVRAPAHVGDGSSRVLLAEVRRQLSDGVDSDREIFQLLEADGTPVAATWAPGPSSKMGRKWSPPRWCATAQHRRRACTCGP
jgi:DNA-binding winged helix-turn-helix (wHTH) protein